MDSSAQAAGAAVSAIRQLCEGELAARADEWDRAGAVPAEVLSQLAKLGCFGFSGRPYTETGETEVGNHAAICEQVGRVSASLLSLVTVHSMVCHSLARWGTSAQRDQWLPELLAGERFAALAVTEPNIGSDVAHVETRLERAPSGYRLSGRKKWISFGERADLFLVLAQADDGPVALLVPASVPGLSRRPMRGLLGFQAAMLAEIDFDACPLPEEAVLGRIGFGWPHIAGTALDHGRFSIAWGAVGLCQACVDATVAYTAQRRQFGQPLREHQLVRGMVADMVTETSAARALAERAKLLREASQPEALVATAMAKYYAGRKVVDVANAAVQLHGANGCGGDFPVQRYYRDAKVFEIIEGSNQIQQLMISQHVYDSSGHQF